MMNSFEILMHAISSDRDNIEEMKIITEGPRYVKYTSGKYLKVFYHDLVIDEMTFAPSYSITTEKYNADDTLIERKTDSGIDPSVFIQVIYNEIHPDYMEQLIESKEK